MDSLTHIVVGACIGEAFAGKQLGKRAMFLGAVAQSVPDIDFITSFWMGDAEHLLAHRGFTHSILFILLVTPLLALISERWHRPHNISMRKWLLFWGIQGLLHLLLDGFNVYGVGWLEPFSHQRFSFNTLFVADPLFSIWPAIAFTALLILKRKNKTRVLYWVSGLLAAGAYLVYSMFNKIQIDTATQTALRQQKMAYTDYFTTPTPLNNWLWYIAAKSDSGFYIGYRSVFDEKPHIDFHFFPQNDSLLAHIDDEEALQHLVRFSQGYYTVEKWHDTVVFNDLRFGQIVGWADPGEKFVFHYYLRQGLDNDLVVQRGRFAKLDRKNVAALLERIRGN